MSGSEHPIPPITTRHMARRHPQESRIGNSLIVVVIPFPFKFDTIGDNDEEAAHKHRRARKYPQP